MEKGILDIVGGKIVDIVTPVSICMLLVVLLVHILNPHGEDPPVSNLAVMVYNEQATDSLSEKLGGALLNAFVFVVIVTLITFMLVAVFYYRCTKCLRAYMGLSAFTVIVWMGGIVAVQIIKLYSIPVDAITFLICIINFASVGVAAVLCRIPILVTQAYLIVIGMLMAFWFTKLPEWTTWVLLLALAAYDVLAVLTPRGPLNLLLELANKRDEVLPALIYETRPTVPIEIQMPPSQAQMTSSDAERSRLRRWIWRRTSQSSNAPPDTEVGDSPRLSGNEQRNSTLPTSVGDSQNLITGHPTEPEVGIMVSRLISSSGEGDTSYTVFATTYENQESDSQVDDDTTPLVQWQDQSSTSTGTPGRLEAGSDHQSRPMNGSSQSAEEDDEHIGLGHSGAIKLGLGDFIFYSLLVGRAAMYDLMTVYACYLAIMAGLGATLILLVIWQRPLPALPISISLGVLFYFLTRLVMDPFVLDMSTNLVFF